MAQPEDCVISAEPVRGPSDDEPSAEGLLDRLRRERADFLNYKRRVERERSEDAERVRAEVVQQLLPVLDELDLALSRRPADLARHPWANGVELSRRTLLDALRELGVERIGEEGEPFDPERHEALFYQQQPGIAEPLVAAVFRHGYRLRDKVLRPAQVTVAGPVDAEDALTQEATDEPGVMKSKRVAHESQAASGGEREPHRSSRQAHMGMGG
jgi:molecular chaperone GrpE